ncbi:low temperature requirement protein A [Virgisporangium aurantiacum]|uniref:Low temperature requirement protein A n=1 Tax=Virgisporangium aurantiacum TaxID=175570 RepID=A0A8J3Z069_9ACTN|nr:low temperature requirement protein A [Virgisporangium aurantiacum]GIJ52920.1 low temperature requirement protein A [Virgisporangium aurantiacum]
MTAEPAETPTAEETGQVRVSTLELFFDLVFVFTITQLTEVLADHLDLIGVVRVTLMLGVIWWMYSAYAWLTNAMTPSSPLRRVLLLVGMGSFLAVALAVPDAFGAAGWLFGLGYLVVNLVHTGAFALAGGEGVLRALRGGLALLNLLSSSLVLAGGILTGPWRYGLWALAFAIQAATPYLSPIGGFSIAAGHFVERHGLVVIIALGESIIAIGVGVRGYDLGLSIVFGAMLVLTVLYYMYWVYFGGDDERAEHVLAATADPTRRAYRAVHAFGWAHIPMLLGIVAFAAGVKKIIGHPFDAAKIEYALAVAGGVLLYLIGHAVFLLVLGLGRLRYALMCGVLIPLVALPLGLVSAALMLGAIIVVFAVSWFVEAGGPRPVLRAWRAGDTPGPHSG